MLLLAVSFSTATLAKVDGIRALIAVAQQKAQEANDDAQSAAEKQKKLIEQKKVTRDAAKKEVAERYDAAMHAAQVQISIAAVSQAAAAASALCNSDSKGIKPLVITAQKKSALAKREALAAADKVRKLIEQKKSDRDKKELLERLKQLETAATRQNEIAEKLRALMQEVAKLKICRSG